MGGGYNLIYVNRNESLAKKNTWFFSFSKSGTQQVSYFEIKNLCTLYSSGSKSLSPLGHLIIS